MALLAQGKSCPHGAERSVECTSVPGEFPSEGAIRGTPQISHQIHASAQSSNAPQAILQESILIIPDFQVSFSEADQALQEYMTTMLPEFPFVPLPSKKSSEMIREQPFLTKTILWVCRPPSPEISAAFHSWFRQQISHETVVLMNNNLELVQALLVFLAW